MKFLCVPCDTPMTLQTVAPPDRGSLSIVYTCPECGYEMAMLTNAYETQVVQSLGVRIGRAGAPAESGCPFTAMIPLATPKPLGEGGGNEPTQRPDAAEPLPVRAMGRTNSGLFASRASAAAVHRTGIGSPAVTGRASSAPGIIAVNGQPLPASTEASAWLAEAPSARTWPVPIRTPRDWTTCVSYALVSIAIS